MGSKCTYRPNRRCTVSSGDLCKLNIQSMKMGPKPIIQPTCAHTLMWPNEPKNGLRHAIYIAWPINLHTLVWFTHVGPTQLRSAQNGPKLPKPMKSLMAGLHKLMPMFRRSDYHTSECILV